VKSSIVPPAFWYLSVAGGAVLLGYALHRHDPVFVLGQGGGLLIYSRNLWFTLRSPAPAGAGPGGANRPGAPGPPGPT
jgi:lipid-A-disaccharide synthase-like uncharacterized protein